MIKYCYKCNVTKDESEFHKDSSRTDGLANACKDCRCSHHSATERQCLACGEIIILSSNNKQRKYCSEMCNQLYTKYKIGKNEYFRMFEQQNGKCCICNEKETNIDVRSGKVFSLSVDHNHKDGKVRGLLCHSCNTGIGLLKDDITILESAINYLKAYAYLP